MLSPEERKLITTILLVILLGAVVKACRSNVTMEEIPKDPLPSLDDAAKAEPPVD
jgi:hypothetical protein